VLPLHGSRANAVGVIDTVAGEQTHMAAPSLDYTQLFAKDLPAGIQPWGGFPACFISPQK